MSFQHNWRGYKQPKKKQVLPNNQWRKAGFLTKKDNSNEYSLLWKSSKLHIMWESLQIFKQPKHKAKKFQQNNTVNPSQRTNITHVPAQAEGTQTELGKTQSLHKEQHSAMTSQISTHPLGKRQFKNTPATSALKTRQPHKPLQLGNVLANAQSSNQVTTKLI